ncbi:Uncharacterized protein APZ42_020107 [Daphnia magna]|uniref:Uncharacterized protein n=1 Tax=Daphnia magna TaxID=35525 RepID=A0A164Y020_9CRUS|nr:Uncharacterized protein APZ42_020107 [Daphnia magna]
MQSDFEFGFERFGRPFPSASCDCNDEMNDLEDLKVIESKYRWGLRNMRALVSIRLSPTTANRRILPAPF